MNIRNFLLSFAPHSAHISLAEKLRSGLAGGAAILLLALAIHHLPQHDYPLLMLASMASSTALLFAAPHSPFSQPWNLVGGHFISALAGWICSLLIIDPALAGGAAVGIAISLTYILKCLHPPSAATALAIVLNSTQFHSMGWQWGTVIVIANVGILLLLTLLINNLVPGRRYPMPLSTHGHQSIEQLAAPEKADIERALEQMDRMLDISTEDLIDIYAKAAEHARERRNSIARVV